MANAYEIAARKAAERADPGAGFKRGWREQARPEQLPPDGEWRTAYFQGGRGCIAGHTRLFLPLAREHVPVADLAAAGEPITVLALTQRGLAATVAEPPFLKGTAPLVEVAAEGGHKITVTSEHRFLTPAGWRHASQCRYGDWLATIDGTPAGWRRITSIVPAGEGPFYDLHVPGPENYLAEGIWHHNSGKTWSCAHILAEWIMEDPEPGEWGIVAPTYQDAWSTCVEGPSGFLAALGTTVTEVRDGKSKLVEHWHRSFAELKLRNGHLVRVASAQDGGLRVQGKNLKGSWCIGEGELITTLAGQVPVEQVRPGDLVATRDGWHRVRAAALTRRNAPLVRLTAPGGRTLRLTANHRVWTQNRGWRMASELTPADIIILWAQPNTSLSLAHLPSSCGTATSGTTTIAPATTGIAHPGASMLPCGNTPTSKGAPLGTTCATKTRTRPATIRPTWNSRNAVSTSQTTPVRMGAAWPAGIATAAARQPRRRGHVLSGSSYVPSVGESAGVQARLRNTAPMRAAPPHSSPAAKGLATSTPAPPPTPPTPSGAIQRHVSAPAWSAVLPTGPQPHGPSTALLSAALLLWPPADGLSPVRTAASSSSPRISPRSGAPIASAKTTVPSRERRGHADSQSSGSASIVAGSTSPGRTTTPSTAPRSAGMPHGWCEGSLTRWPEPDGAADVYDLSIEGEPEFFAGGILVHNCDEVGLWENWDTTWNESIKFAVREGEARIVASGTPKQSRKARKLIKLLLDDPDVPVRRLRTIDNAPNLAPRFLAEVVGKAKGTRLERQELEGVLLDDVEGALWTAEIIDAYRVKVPPADLLRVVVAIDPAVSNEEGSDETGIMVVGEADGGHGFVLEDCSLRGTPDECMKRAVRAYYQWQADRVIGEANNGGDYIGTLLHTVDPNVPYSKVIATRGKRVRAEPVSALYAQGRMHHVGVFIDLEEQMVGWVPSDPGDSPDRVDALVWACAELKSLSSGSWLAAYGTMRCETCETVFPEAYGACPQCHPEAARKPAPKPKDQMLSEPEPMTGWAAAYGATRCGAGHVYIGRLHPNGCPKCGPGGMGGRRNPFAFPALPGIGRMMR